MRVHHRDIIGSMSMNDHELLTQINGIGDKTANDLLNHFGSGRKVAQSACRYWGELLNVDGFTEERAKNLFHDMKDAGVFKELRGY